MVCADTVHVSAQRAMMARTAAMRLARTTAPCMEFATSLYATVPLSGADLIAQRDGAPPTAPGPVCALMGLACVSLGGRAMTARSGSA